MTMIYDQSPMGNHLSPAPGGAYVKTPDVPANATALKLTVNGHAVYGVHLPSGTGYRNDVTVGVATGNNPETVYMVTSGTYYNGQCCFDYGNAEKDNSNDGSGTMEAVYFGNVPYFGHTGTGNGPWVMADLENGVYGGNNSNINTTNMPLPDPYVTAMVKGQTNGFALKGANAQSDMTLTTEYDGPRPTQSGIPGTSGDYQPMRKEGAIILGIGGDNSNGGEGDFYEGVMTAGTASDATDDAVQANIVAARYGM
jgi:hypothetical protein